MRLREITRLLEVLSEPIRLRIIHLLFQRQDAPVAVGALVEALQIPQPTVSRHLAILREEQLVDVVAEGTFRLYALADRQEPLHRAVLAALESFVVEGPEAREDLRRLHRTIDRGETGLTTPSKKVTNKLHDDAAMGSVFAALGSEHRRRILDIVEGSPGISVQAVADRFVLSRVAVMKHLAVLEAAGLLHSMKEGRTRRLYHDAVPIQMIYDRWTDRWSSAWASRMLDVKYRVEERR